MRFVYLHGFASSPASRKARAFAEAARRQGFHLEIPDLDEGHFENMTLSSQLKVVERLLKGQSARLIGSSMGGYLAGLYASSHPEVERLVLLAPAFRFAARWQELSGPASIQEWKDSGWLDVYHYGTKSARRIGYELFSDALRHPAQPTFTQPTLILHGCRDETVPIRFSREFVANHSAAALRELDSDHELLNVLDEIVDDGVSFLTEGTESQLHSQYPED